MNSIHDVIAPAASGTSASLGRRAARLVKGIVLASLLTGATYARSEEGAAPPTAPPVVRGFMVPSPGLWDFTAPKSFFDDAKSWGASVVRIQIDPMEYAKAQKKDVMAAWPDLLDLAEAAVDRARQAGLKVVVDVHNPPIQGVVRTSAQAWDYPDLDKNFCQVWQDLSTRLKPFRDAVWGYDLFNEPVLKLANGTNLRPPKWRPLAEKLIGLIRQTDPDTWIIYEDGPWGGPQTFIGQTPLADKKVIYSVHYYEPNAFTHQGIYNIKGTHLSDAMKVINVKYPGVVSGEMWDKARMEKELAPVIEFQNRYHVPIYVGEFSVVRWAPEESALTWLGDAISIFEEHHWSWTYHAFRESHVWSLEHDSQFWMKNMPNPEPAKQETKRAALIKKAFSLNAP